VRANVKDASLAIILADDQINNPDAYSIIIGNELEKMNPLLIKIAEITDERWKSILQIRELMFLLLRRNS